jgi:hypothetical protein
MRKGIMIGGGAMSGNGAMTVKNKTPTFSQRHYDALAAVLKEVRDRPTKDWDNIYDNHAVALADLFSKDNPRFDRVKWYRATRPQIAKMNRPVRHHERLG